MPHLRSSGFLARCSAIFSATIVLSSAVFAVPEIPVPSVAHKVLIWLDSDANGRVVQPGEEIGWAVRIRVAGPNRGLALISLDLVQGAANPAFINLERGERTSSGMEAFDFPAGFTNPGPGPTYSGFGGTPVTSSLGGANLLQIGGAQNTFGVAGPCMGVGASVCTGQSVTVAEGVGRHGDGQQIATGVFQAPETAGFYRFVLHSVQVSVLGRSTLPPLATSVHRIVPTLQQAELSIWVQTEEDLTAVQKVTLADGKEPFSVGMMAAGKMMALDTVLRPADGIRLNRTHVRFWWPAVPGADNYVLEIVQDDGSGDPFALGTVMSHPVASAEPRMVVTEGLEFGRDYAWRVAGATQVNRFSIIDLPAALTPFQVSRPNAGDLEPGVTLFNLVSLSTPVSIPGAMVVAVDETGAPVYFHQRELVDEGTVGYVQIQPTGRLLVMRGRLLQGGGGSIFEETIDGRVTWSLPDDRGYIPHHDVQLMPDGNLLFLLHEDLFLPEDNGESRRADRIVVMDRHTLEELWVWRAVEHYPLENGSVPISRWTHGNAVFYHPPHNSIYFSSRHFSRISRIDFATGEIVFNMGMDWPAGDTDFGDGFFFFQHAPEMQPSGNMVVFDNGNGRFPLQTRVVEIEFDDPLLPSDAAVVREDWLVDEAGQPLFVSFAGDADRLPNGNTLVMAGAINRVQELGPDGKLLWNMSLRLGQDAYRAYRAQRLKTVVMDTPGDRDGDWDVDLIDLAGLQAGYGSSELGFPDRLSDFDGDGDLDNADLLALVNFMTGPVE